MRLVEGVELDLTGEAPAAAGNAGGVPVASGRLQRLEVRGLSYQYPGSDNGIRDIDLDLARGSFTVVTGRIGAGKTTLLRALLGLVRPDSGEVLWNGEAVVDAATWMTPPHAAYTPQVPSLFSMSLRDNASARVVETSALFDRAPSRDAPQRLLSSVM